MKRFVNGVEIELESGAARVHQLGDVLMVQADGQTRSALAVRQGDTVLVSYQGQVYEVTQSSRVARGKSGAGSGEIRAPMPGAIVAVLVSEGQTVSAGDKLVVLEAMKTQQAFSAPFDGTVESVLVKAGDQVGDAQLLVKIIVQAN